MAAVTRRRVRMALVAFLATFAVAGYAFGKTDGVVVFAAASLTDALQDIGEQYVRETGERVRFSFASSSTLARQIEAGAPADIFASANEAWMDYLETRGLVDASTRTSPIGNSLILVAPGDSPIDGIDIGAGTDLRVPLGVDGRLVMGDPDHVPAGIYAKKAMQSLGMWETVAPRLARTDDVRAALALVERGEAPLGIVYATDAAIAKHVKVLARFPADSHPPITYPVAIIADRGTPAVRRFFAYMTGQAGLKVFEGYGFTRN